MRKCTGSQFCECHECFGVKHGKAANGCLDDAVKGKISMSGQALLQWGFTSNGFASHSVQMPEVVVDQVLRWRDQSLAPNSALDGNDQHNK
jgi:hypothetical protein